MSAKDDLIARQKGWATSVGLMLDKYGYLSSIDDYFFRSLSTAAKLGLEGGSGSELVDGAEIPAKIKAPHSSSALVVNIFDAYSDMDRGPLERALKLESTIIRLAFEEQYPTGLGGTPPNLDVVLEHSDGHIIAIESKFSEWLGPGSVKKQFVASYFPEGEGLWQKRGLVDSQSLAEAIQYGQESFRHFDVTQLLKHALGLATQLGQGFSLHYLYFDWPGPESDVHNSEINRFKKAVGEELRFRAISYQELFSRVSKDGKTDQEYIAYMRTRYFQQN